MKPISKPILLRNSNKADVSRDKSASQKALTVMFHDFFSFKSRPTFETKFLMPGYAVPKLRLILYFGTLLDTKET